jgi:hypothetical protein
VRAVDARELHGARAERAGGADDEEALARAQPGAADDELEHGARAEERAGRRDVGHARRHGHEPGGVHRDELGVRPHGRPVHPGDGVADGEAGDVGAHGLDDPRERAAEDGLARAPDAERQAAGHGEPAREAAGSDARVAGGHRRRVDADDDLSAPGDGVGALDAPRDLGRTVPLDDDCAHRCSLHL